MVLRCIPADFELFTELLQSSLRYYYFGKAALLLFSVADLMPTIYHNFSIIYFI